ncbi:LOW QUALITY PROTEIN: hypothetical protein ACG7TL_005410 [Trametes sanguinea]
MHALQEDDAFKRAVARGRIQAVANVLEQKNKEAQLSEDKQRDIIVHREKYAPTTLRTAEARDLQLKMSDTTIFKLVQALERGDSIRAFLALYQCAKEGKLTRYQTFVDICAVLEKQLSLAESDSPGAKKGISHILGSTLSLDDCVVDEVDDITRIVAHVRSEKKFASQVPPLVIALRPTKGNDDAASIYALHVRLLDMAEQLGIKIISLSANENVDKQDDGTARQLFHYTALEAMTSQDASGCTYVQDEFLGLFVYLFIFGKVTAKKERTACAGYVLDYDPTPLTAAELEHARVRLPEESVNRLVEVAHKEATQIAKQLLRLPIPALPFSQIPLRPPPMLTRSHLASKAAPAREDSDEEDDDDVHVNDDDDDDDDDEELDGDLREEGGLGETEFGASASAISSVQADGLDDPALMAQLAKRTAEAVHYTARLSALSEDLDSTVNELTEEELACLQQPGKPGPLAHPLPSPLLAGLQTVMNSSPLVFASKILDNNDKIVIWQMLDLRQEHQSSTSTHSERVVKVDPKFALSRLEHPDKKMSIREASHVLRVAQDLAGPPVDRLKSTRERHWQEVARNVQEVVKEQDLPNLPSKNVTAINPLRPGSFVIMKNDRRTYLGEVLDLYKKTKNRHGSLDVAATLGYCKQANLTDSDAPSDSTDKEFNDNVADATSLAPPFSCRNRNVDIHTHAPADQLLYHLGLNAASGPHHSLALKAFAASRWSALTRRKVQEKLVIRIPARPVDSAPATIPSSST